MEHVTSTLFRETLKGEGPAFTVGTGTIVGVTPAGFPGPQVGRSRPLYVPMMMQAIMRPPRGSTGCSTEAASRRPPRMRAIEPANEPM